ncbi:4-carboxymuconolactone decarboxylase [Lacihabitans sp. CCS-44]|jgi:alkylhydroperoxidase/carboxymuconolactone decarboxylase family protein|uniref:arsenosugar biosynthesis-associated peroxidase-like protein n=1 Tax=Lacihabitans sp. CCS-44 TaxID=2487331 RepID=UPI0020CBAD8F|nr:arsenosugar biosynthesis-associated peroxidase-like protein [Lacihabitans sp. CCS-44]MCP9757427.1 4-carboxymuconolactone decarboxylase [Lacihabitans sp. CCS-44]
MSSYYNSEDLPKFGKIGEFGAKDLAKDFFKYYGETFKDGALTEREKSLIALAVAHTMQCPYCIDAYTTDTIQKGCTQDEMMEAVHVAAALAAGVKLVHSVQMINKAKEVTM